MIKLYDLVFILGSGSVKPENVQSNILKFCIVIHKRIKRLDAAKWLLKFLSFNQQASLLKTMRSNNAFPPADGVIARTRSCCPEDRCKYFHDVKTISVPILYCRPALKHSVSPWVIYSSKQPSSCLSEDHARLSLTAFCLSFFIYCKANSDW